MDQPLYHMADITRSSDNEFATLWFRRHNGSMSWITDSQGGAMIQVHATPRASKSEIQGLHGEAVKIRLKAPPVDGKANDALIEFLADSLGIPQRQITLLSGQTSRQKRLSLQGVTARQVADAFGISIA